MELENLGLFRHKCSQCGNWFYTTNKYKMICYDCDGEKYETYKENKKKDTKERLD